MDPHRLAEERSLAYHRAIVERLRSDPAIVERARDHVRRWLSEGRRVSYARRWEELLSGPIEDLCRLLVADTEAARALRQSTPFAGALDARERWGIWRAVRQAAERG